MQRKRYDSETKEKAIRLVLDHQEDYSSRWGAIQGVAKRLGMTPETLRSWINQHEIDHKIAPGLTSETKER